MSHPLRGEAVVGGMALVCGRDGIIQSVVREDMGLLGDSAVGSNFAELVDQSSLEKAQRFLAEAISGGAAFDWELGFRRDGAIQLLHFAAAASPPDSLLLVGGPTRSAVIRYYDELMKINNEQANALRSALKSRVGEAGSETRPDAFDSMMRLNNELATVQRELTKKNIELERTNELKNQLLGMAAHDLRTPIGAISSYSELLLDAEMALPEEQRRQFLERIRESSSFMLALINDLLDLSAIEAGQLRIDATQIDIARLVSENVQLNQVLAQDKGIEVIAEIASDIPAVTADAVKLEQTLHNLLSNAVKFSDPGTKVLVRVTTLGDEVRIDVADEGPGIPPQEISEIFKPFQRGTPKSTRNERSTGLGLAIVKRVVEGHGGRLHCESEVGRGTTFSVWIPVNAPG